MFPYVRPLPGNLSVRGEPPLLADERPQIAVANLLRHRHRSVPLSPIRHARNANCGRILHRRFSQTFDPGLSAESWPQDTGGGAQCTPKPFPLAPSALMALLTLMTW